MPFLFLNNYPLRMNDFDAFPGKKYALEILFRALDWKYSINLTREKRRMASFGRAKTVVVVCVKIRSD